MCRRYTCIYWHVSFTDYLLSCQCVPHAATACIALKATFKPLTRVRVTYLQRLKLLLVERKQKNPDHRSMRVCRPAHMSLASCPSDLAWQTLACPCLSFPISLFYIEQVVPRSLLATTTTSATIIRYHIKYSLFSSMPIPSFNVFTCKVQLRLRLL